MFHGRLKIMYICCFGVECSENVNQILLVDDDIELYNFANFLIVLSIVLFFLNLSFLYCSGWVIFVFLLLTCLFTL